MFHKTRSSLVSLGDGSLARRMDRTLGHRGLNLSKKLLLSSSFSAEPLTLTHPVIPLVQLPRVGGPHHSPPPALVEDKPDFFKEFEKSLNMEILKQKKIKVKKSFERVPQILNSKLAAVSDSHLKLSEILSYKDTFRLKHGYLEKFLRNEFREKYVHIVYQNHLSTDLLVKIACFYSSQKNFIRIAEIYKLLYDTKSVRVIEDFNNSILQTLANDSDHYLGFFSIMKHLYISSGMDIEKFRDFYNFINTNNSLKRNKSPSTSFIEILQTVQLQSVILAASNVAKLPQVYFETKFPIVDVTLVQRLLKQGEVDRAFDLIESKKLHKLDGLFLRLIEVQSNDENLHRRLVKLMSRMIDYPFKEIDFVKWRKFSTNEAFHTESLKAIQGSTSLPQFQTQYIYKLLKENQMKKAILFLKKNIENAHFFDTKVLSLVLLHTHDLDYFHKVLKRLAEDKREELIHVSILRTIKDKKLSINQKWSKLGSILKNIELNPQCAETLATFVKGSKNPSQVIELFKQISFKTDESLNRVLESLDTKVAMHVSAYLFTRKRLGIEPFSKFMVQSLSIDHIIKILCNLAKHHQYRYLHSSITKLFIRSGDLEVSEALISATGMDSVPKSVELVLEAKILSGSFPNIDITSFELSPVQVLYLKTLSRLVNLEDISLNNAFKRDISTLYKSGKIDTKILSVELLRHLVSKIKDHSHSNEVIMTARLKYYLENCIRNGVQQDEIDEILNN